MGSVDDIMMFELGHPSQMREIKDLLRYQFLDTITQNK